MTIQGTIQGLHHITLVSANAQRTVDFYVGVLGLRLVKQTVNFDDPGSYHLYFGDETGRPGTAGTFFEWAHSPKGHPGIGGEHHFSLPRAGFEGPFHRKAPPPPPGLTVYWPPDLPCFQN